MNRRDFISLVSGGAAWPIAARAQQPDRVRRIGVLMGFPESDSQAQGYIAAFRGGLQKLGWMEDRDVQIGTRWVIPAEADLMRQIAKELVALQPDLILSNTTPTTTALLQQTRTIPIVFGGWNAGRPAGLEQFQHSVGPVRCSDQSAANAIPKNPQRNHASCA